MYVWEKQRFELDKHSGRILHDYCPPKNSSEAIPLDAVHTASTWGGSLNGCRFDIVLANGRVLSLMGESPEDCEKWVNQITEQIKGNTSVRGLSDSSLLSASTPAGYKTKNGVYQFISLLGLVNQLWTFFFILILDKPMPRSVSFSDSSKDMNETKSSSDMYSFTLGSNTGKYAPLIGTLLCLCVCVTGTLLCLCVCVSQVRSVCVCVSQVLCVCVCHGYSLSACVCHSSG